MDDIKRLIEKYKRELMEYSRAAAPEKGLDFPEMLPETDEQPEPEISADTLPEPEAANVPETPQEPFPPLNPETAPEDEILPEERSEPAKAADIPAESPERKASSPKIIGYVSGGSEGGALPESFSRLFSDLLTDEKGELPPDGGETVYDRFAGGNEELRYEDIDPAPADESAQTQTPQRGTVPSIDDTQERITYESEPAGNDTVLRPVNLGDKARIEQRQEFVEPQSVLPEVAERLPDRPVSGRDINEQLARRTFDDNRTAPNDRGDIAAEGSGQGSGRQPVIYNEREYESYEDFESTNRQRGLIGFRVYTARGALPIKGAECTVTKTIAGAPYVIFTKLSDESGSTPTMPLPAPPRSLSQSPDNIIMPYALYDATVKAEGYSTVELSGIPIFDGVTSIQRVAMIPANSGSNEETEVSDA